MIYYLLDQKRQLLKIGCSRDTTRRARELRLREKCRDALLLAVEPGSFGREREQHDRFSLLRIKDLGREWFQYSGALKLYVEDLAIRCRDEPRKTTITVSGFLGVCVIGHHIFGWSDEAAARLIYCDSIPVRMTIERNGKGSVKWCWNCHTVIVIPESIS